MAYEAEHIANSLKRARLDKGLSQRELAKRCGVPQSHISKIESNAVDLRLSSLITIASALDLEFTLFQRKAAPAIQSIIRSAALNKARNERNVRAHEMSLDDAPPSRPAYSLDEDEDDV